MDLAYAPLPILNPSPTRTVCRCLGVAAQDIEDAILFHGANSVADLKRLTGAGSGCGCCCRDLRRMLGDADA